MDTIDELLARIQNARRRIGISKHPAWYRGHSRGTFTLLPSLLRHELGPRHERNLMSVFLTRSAGLLPASSASSWEHLVVMQHHGAPTRLLDWTESLDVALFFAVAERPRGPTIWILNPFRLNQLSVGEKLIFDKSDSIFYDYYTEIRDRRTLPHELPIAMRAPWMNPRIGRQRGCFTVHGSRPDPLESFPGAFVKRVDIPQHLVKQLVGYLKVKGMDDFDLFPDLDGLCRSLRRRFRLL